ncbi:GatB family leaderless bacteriocin [Priestia flexa]|nr:leaderless bacteriocin [Priestia flexa]WEZ08481.1 leaderless bacteriocin [Priestia flexa]
MFIYKAMVGKAFLGGAAGGATYGALKKIFG